MVEITIPLDIPDVEIVNIEVNIEKGIKISDELAEIFKILKIVVLRYDVKLEPYPYNVE